MYGFPWDRISHPDPFESPQLQIWPHWSDTGSPPSVLHVGEQKIVGCCRIRRIGYGRWSTISEPQSHTAAIYPMPSQKCLQPYFSKSWITYRVCVYLERNNATIVSGKGESNACQDPLLWPHSFLVSLLTLQPTLVRLFKLIKVRYIRWNKYETFP